MTAKIIPFPQRKRGVEVEQVGALLREVVPIPSRDTELAVLVATVDHLLSNYDDELLDSFLADMAAWESENARS